MSEEGKSAAAQIAAKLPELIKIAQDAGLTKEREWLERAQAEAHRLADLPAATLNGSGQT